MSQDVVAQRPRALRPVPFIAAGLVLIVLAATGSALVLHRRDTEADRQARRRLDAATFVVQAVGVATTHRVAVVIDLTSTIGARLVDASVRGEGWQVTHDKAVGLARAVDCTSPTPPPESAAAVVELHGQRRTVDLLAGSSVFDVVRSTGREACGDVDAGRAVLGKASATTRSGARLALDLTLTNRSVHAIRLRGVAVEGLRVLTSRPLPLVLAPRSTRRLHVVMVLAGCPAAGQVGAGEREVELSLDGTGGPATSGVASSRLQEQVAVLQREGCG